VKELDFDKIYKQINFEELYLNLGGNLSQSPCAYFKEKTHIAHTIFLEPEYKINDKIFDILLSKGYRRSGPIFYKSICPGCGLCVPIRINVNDFTLSKSQKRVLRKNTDIEIKYDENICNEEKFELMNLYLLNKHDHKKLSYTDFKYYYYTSPVSTIDFKYYFKGKLIGVGIVDLAYNSLSTVYFYFDMNFAKLSPGVFSIIKEIQYAELHNKNHYYLGYYINSHNKMNYKTHYRPYELFVDNKWRQYRQ
jgi:arginine-tRNA-protein transferase